MVCASDPRPPVPEYSDADLDWLVMAVQRMTTLFALNEADWNDSNVAVIKEWLLNVEHLLLTIFYDGDTLTACLSFPLAPAYDLSYFLRDPNHVFTVERFHDDINFGTLHEDIEGSMLTILETVYAPHFFRSNNLGENVKGRFYSALHSFLAFLTGLHYKMGGITVLYIPSEAFGMDVEVAAHDRDLVKRLEAVAVYWMGQIRECLSDKELLVPYNLMCPPDEFDFWTYRREYNNIILIFLVYKLQII